MGRNLILIGLAGVTVALAVGTVSLNNAITEVQNKGVKVKLPMIGTVDVSLKGGGPATIILPPAATDTLTNLPRTLAITAAVAMVLTGGILWADGAK